MNAMGGVAKVIITTLHHLILYYELILINQSTNLVNTKRSLHCLVYFESSHEPPKGFSHYADTQ